MKPLSSCRPARQMVVLRIQGYEVAEIAAQTAVEANGRTHPARVSHSWTTSWKKSHDIAAHNPGR